MFYAFIGPQNCFQRASKLPTAKKTGLPASVVKEVNKAVESVLERGESIAIIKFAICTEMSEIQTLNSAIKTGPTVVGNGLMTNMGVYVCHAFLLLCLTHLALITCSGGWTGWTCLKNAQILHITQKALTDEATYLI